MEGEYAMYEGFGSLAVVYERWTAAEFEHILKGSMLFKTHN